MTLVDVLREFLHYDLCAQRSAAAFRLNLRERVDDLPSSSAGAADSCFYSNFSNSYDPDVDGHLYPCCDSCFSTRSCSFYWGICRCLDHDLCLVIALASSTLAATGTAALSGGCRTSW